MLKGWRTLGINMAVLIAAALQTAEWPNLVPAQYVGYVVAIVAGVNMALRTITTTPVGTSAPVAK